MTQVISSMAPDICGNHLLSFPSDTSCDELLEFLQVNAPVSVMVQLYSPCVVLQYYNDIIAVVISYVFKVYFGVCQCYAEIINVHRTRVATCLAINVVFLEDHLLAIMVMVCVPAYVIVGCALHDCCRHAIAYDGVEGFTWHPSYAIQCQLGRP